MKMAVFDTVCGILEFPFQLKKKNKNKKNHHPNSLFPYSIILDCPPSLVPPSEVMKYIPEGSLVFQVGYLRKKKIQKRGYAI